MTNGNKLGNRGLRLALTLEVEKTTLAAISPFVQIFTSETAP